jgi:hypothetical protein
MTKVTFNFEKLVYDPFWPIGRPKSTFHPNFCLFKGYHRIILSAWETRYFSRGLQLRDVAKFDLECL